MIVQTPENDEQNNTVTCALCGKPTILTDATMGLLYGNGKQAFAHAAHLQGRTEWFVGWVMFTAAERHKLLEQGIEPLYADDIDDAPTLR